jgi:cold shock CspA family protein
MLRTTSLLICLIGLIGGGIALRAASGYTSQDASALYHAVLIYPPDGEIDLGHSSWSPLATGGTVMVWTHNSPFADSGQRVLGTRVRKQMQKIKQAAQTVRNRVLEIRSTIETSGLDEGEMGYLGVLSADGKIKWFRGKKSYGCTISGDPGVLSFGFIVPDDGGEDLFFDGPVHFILWTRDEFQVLSSTLSIAISPTPEEQVRAVIKELERIEANPDMPLADKAEDARNKAVIALYELTKDPPDNQATLGNIEAAVGDLEAAVKDALLDAQYGTELMDALTYAAWQLAVDAIDAAIAAEANPDQVAKAQKALAEGEDLWIEEAYKDAVAKFKDALAKAEALAKAVIHNLEAEDGEPLGTAGLYYNKDAGTTVVQVDCRALTANDEYVVVLCECADDGDASNCIELGSLTTDENGNGYVSVSVDGDKSNCDVLVAVQTGGTSTSEGDERVEIVVGAGRKGPCATNLIPM